MTETLSSADQTYLSAEQQKQILALKQAWAAASAAGDRAAMDRANQQAEAIRAQAGYAGGADGSGYRRLGEDGTAAPAGAGRSAAEVQQWVTDYENRNYNADRGWVNGYSTAMNLRSMYTPSNSSRERSRSSRRVPDLYISMAGKMRFSASFLSRWISMFPVPLNSS